MKILMLIPTIGRNSSLTGTPAHVLKLKNALEERGTNVLIMETRSRGYDERVTYTASFFGSLIKFPYVIWKEKPDIVHSHTHVSAMIASFFRHIFKYAHVYESHGAPRNSLKKPILSRVLNGFESYVVNTSNAIVTQSVAMKKRFEYMADNRIKKFLVLYPGLKVRQFNSEVINSGKYDKKCIELIYIGTSQSYQGLGLLSKAQKIISNSINIKYRILLSDMSKEHVIEQYKFDIENTIIENIYDSSVIPKYLNNADVLIHTRPDTVDNLNVQSKLGLYLSAEKPILATNVGDYVDLLGGSKGCLLVEPDSKAISTGIVNIVKSLPKYSDSAKNDSLILAKKYFDLSGNIDKLTSFYREITSVHKSCS